MDWSLVLNYAIKIIGSIGASVIVTLASILYAKLQSKIKDSKITAYIKECVKAAEQMYPNLGMKMGTVKYKYVLDCVVKKYPKINDNQYLKSLIEGAVFALNKQLEDKKQNKQEIKKEDETTSSSKPLTSF